MRFRGFMYFNFNEEKSNATTVKKLLIPIFNAAAVSFIKLLTLWRKVLFMLQYKFPAFNRILSLQCHVTVMQEKTIRIAFIFHILEICCTIVFCSTVPQQIHLSLGESPQEMVVTWITFADTGVPVVYYETYSQGICLRAEGCSRVFIDGGCRRTVRFVHRVVLRFLIPNAYYVYRCGSYYGLSNPFIFKVTPKGSDWSPRLIIYGDMGLQRAVTLPYIANEISDYDIDAIVHVGDIAYNMESYDGSVGDQFLRMIEPVASSIPYMTIPGNHEQAYNFSNYKNRFSMPGRSEGLFYSFDLGPAHFIALTTEAYYFPQYGLETIVNQYKWLQKDLKTASKSKNKLLRPWIIVFTHRPLYCSSDTGEDCSCATSILKCCVLNSYNYGLEHLFQKYKVDVIYSGHMHYYERSFPIYNGQAYSGTCCDPYRNPPAPVHIITGAAGMKSGTERASYIRRDWFAFYSYEYSYTILTVVNSTHIYSEQISASRGGQIIDWVWIIKDKK